MSPNRAVLAVLCRAEIGVHRGRFTCFVSLAVGGDWYRRLVRENGSNVCVGQPKLITFIRVEILLPRVMGGWRTAIAARAERVILSTCGETSGDGRGLF